MSKFSILLVLMVASAVALPWHHKTEEENELSASRQSNPLSDGEEDNDSSTSMQSQSRSTSNTNEDDTSNQSQSRSTSNGEEDKDSSTSKRDEDDTSNQSQSRSTSNGEELSFCKTAVTRRYTNSRSTFPPTYVQICRDESRLGACFVSPFKKCCPDDKDLLIKVPSDKHLTVGPAFVAVSHYMVKKDTVCVFFHDKHGHIDECRTKDPCIPRPHAPVNAVCQNNSVENSTCTADGCICKSGYRAPECCECDSSTHVRVEDRRCQPICFSNILECDNKAQCTCKTGYAPPTCCGCSFDKLTDNNAYFLNKWQCKKICKTNALSEHCNATRGCSECTDGFSPPDCCTCRKPNTQVGNVCSDCPFGQVKINGKCTTSSIKNDLADVLLEMLDLLN